MSALGNDWQSAFNFYPHFVQVCFGHVCYKILNKFVAVQLSNERKKSAFYETPGI